MLKQPGRLAAMLAVAFLAFGAATWGAAQPVNPPAFAAVTNDGDGIRVVVAPKKVAAGSAWEFDITMDTHIAPLNADLTKSAVLVVDGSQRYVPLSWEGDKLGGHHRKGVLRFPAPNEQTKSFELRIQGLGRESERVFKWTVK
jgi:hypothetical protein